MTNELNDIIAGCCRGDRQSQEKLYREYASRMYGVCLRYARDGDEAKDVLQDSFLKIFQHMNQFRNEGSFEGWMRRIVVNTALEKIRRQKVTILFEKVPESVDEDYDGDPEPDLSLQEMLTMVQLLPPQYRMVFNLYVFEELTHTEIGHKLGISQGTSKSNLSRARRILQQKINASMHKIVKMG